MTYPHELAGDPAPPPEQPGPRVIAMALKAHLKDREAAGPALEAAGWRLAGSLAQLRAEADAAAPARSRVSDGTIGDAAHAARLSDHNPNAAGVVRALDLTNDPLLNLPVVAERMRARAVPALLGGGYVILNGRITAPDLSHWRAYTGPNPHVAQMHVSASTDPGRYDARAPWGVFSSEQPAPAPPPPPPVAPVPAGFPGPDLTGTGPGLRGEEGHNGPRVQSLQSFLNRNYPAYSRLATDGWWGPRTSAVVAEFGHRSGIGSADGRNIGPRLAAALTGAGFGRLSARDRVRGHIGRRTGR